MKYLLCLIGQLLLASMVSASLLDEAVLWDDEAAKAKVLSNIPSLEQNAINVMNQIYHANLRKVFTTQTAINQYNLAFINANWGPLDNPFNMYPRPAKAFVFLKDSAARLKSSDPALFFRLTSNAKQREWRLLRTR